MNINEQAFGGINTYGGGEIFSGIGFTPDVFPAVQNLVLTINLQAVVSTINILLETTPKAIKRKLKLVSAFLEYIPSNKLYKKYK